MNKKTERIAIVVLAAFLVGMFCYQVAYGINESPWKWGYHYGLRDGKASIRDSVDACEDVFTNSTHNANTCLHAYNLGFKQGCDLIGNHIPGIPNPEFGTCREYFNDSLHLQALPIN
jgi:hypothetical protein